MIDTALLGIDVGTTNVKVVAYDPHGAVIASATRRQEVRTPRRGWAEYDADGMFEAVAEALRTVMAHLGGWEIAGVAAASMAETAVPVGRDGTALYAAIAWHDERTEAQAAWWRDNVGLERIYATTGLPVLPIFGANKLMWLREHEPAVFQQIDTWLNTADWIAFRLSGVRATDLSLASRTMLLDLETRTWSEEMLAAAGLDRATMADLVESGTLVGRVHAQAAARTGLPEGTPVVAGAHDHPCGALALGVVGEGDVLDSMGTSESILTVTERPTLRDDLARSGYQQGVHPVPGRYYCNGGLYTAGAAVEWLRELLGVDSAQSLVREVDAEEAEEASSVFFLPHLRMASPPIVDPAARAAFVGVTARTTRADLIRAVLEGLAFEAQASLDAMEKLLGFETGSVRAIGGGARIERLVRDKAALLGHEVQIADVDEATTLGAAALAGVGSGVFRDVEEASTSMAPSWRSVRPDTTAQVRLRAGYDEVYKHVYPSLAPLHRRIEAWYRQEGVARTGPSD